MHRMFEDMTPRISRGEVEPTFPVDLFETDDTVVVKAPLPGIKAEDLEITLSDGSLIIKGEAKHQGEVDEDHYHRREIVYGSFYRSVPLPGLVEFDKAEAQVRDGVLTVTLPKAEAARPKTIKVKAE
jgi:HSP20 family protein